MAKCTDKPSNHGKCMSSGQALDVHESGAHARPWHYQLVPSQYRSGRPWVRGKRRYGLAVGGRESLFWGSCSNSIVSFYLNSKCVALVTALLYLPAITLLPQLRLPWACDQFFSKKWHYLCTSRIKVSCKWTGPDSPTQNTWNSVQ